jgi:hypothetical protein
MAMVLTVQWFMPSTCVIMLMTAIPDGGRGAYKANVKKFRRIAQWQLGPLKLLLGSDLIIFQKKDHGPVSVHLHDMTTPFTPLDCLDLWLDNVFCSIPETAVRFKMSFSKCDYANHTTTHSLCCQLNLANTSLCTFHKFFDLFVARLVHFTYFSACSIDLNQSINVFTNRFQPILI